MAKISEQELKDILDKHAKYLQGMPDGCRANLMHANLRHMRLSGANLSRANLSRADLSGAELNDTDLTGAELNGADLTCANLIRAKLVHADLNGADMRSADLSHASLSGANLSHASLSGANLSHASLSDANLSHANLSGADLSGADMRSADLSHASLSGADLSGADLSEIKKDFFKRMTIAKNEVDGLYDALMRGKIEGSAYKGECACFCGTIANLRKEPFNKMSIGLRPESASPTERWFLAINKGDTPQSNPASSIAKTWIEEFAKENGINLPSYKLVSSFEHQEIFNSNKIEATTKRRDE